MNDPLIICHAPKARAAYDSPVSRFNHNDPEFKTFVCLRIVHSYHPERDQYLFIPLHNVNIYLLKATPLYAMLPIILQPFDFFCTHQLVLRKLF